MSKRGLVLGLESAKHIIESAFERLIDTADEDFGQHLDVGFIADLRRQAVQHILDSNPSHPCPWCNRQGCMTCHGTGWVPKAIHDRAPRELKGGAA